MSLLKDIKINFAEKFESFPYQKEAVEAIKDLKYAAIFHEQGLGKTKIAIDLLLYWLREKLVDTVLVVVKKGLIENWKKEFQVHTYIKPRVLSQDKKGNFYIFNSQARVIIAHFELFNSETERIKLFCKIRKIGIIIDESVKIKNPESRLTKSFTALSPLFERRIIMTGTPIANRPYDIWAQIYFLDQGETFGKDFYSFRSNYDLDPDLNRDQEKRDWFEDRIAEIFKKISKFSVRDTKNSGIIELPNKVYEDHFSDWEDSQLDIYEKYIEESKSEFIKNGNLIVDDANAILKKLLRLVQVTSNPRLVNPIYDGIPGKFPILQELVDQIQLDNEKCIIWTNFNENVEWLEREFRCLKAKKIYGKMNMEQRNKSVTSFIEDPSVRVLIATPGAAKEGLTLTIANHVIFYDRGFSLDDYLQAQDRIHRISQKKTCFVHNIIMRGSIDEWVNLLLHAKHDVAQLGQGDIDLDEFSRKIDYGFSDILRGILHGEGVNE